MEGICVFRKRRSEGVSVKRCDRGGGIKGGDEMFERGTETGGEGEYEKYIF